MGKRNFDFKVREFLKERKMTCTELTKRYLDKIKRIDDKLKFYLLLQK